MTQILNQFAQSTEQGLLDLALNPNILNVRIDPASTDDFVAGTAVTLTDAAGKVTLVDKAAIDDDILGFVVYSAKKSVPVAGDFIEVAIQGSVMHMTASEAIARGGSVEIVVASDKVAPADTAGATIVGKALDKAAADGDLIRVIIGTGVNNQAVVPTP